MGKCDMIGKQRKTRFAGEGVFDMLKFREDSPILIQSFYRISTEHFEPYIAQFSRGVDVYDFANVSKKCSCSCAMNAEKQRAMKITF